MIAVSSEAGETEGGPLAQALRQRARLLGDAFRSVVFAQVRISALNTVLTGLFWQEKEAQSGPNGTDFHRSKCGERLEDTSDAADSCVLSQTLMSKRRRSTRSVSCNVRLL
jgi:hypothetical protein